MLMHFKAPHTLHSSRPLVARPMKKKKNIYRFNKDNMRHNDWCDLNQYVIIRAQAKHNVTHNKYKEKQIWRVSTECYMFIQKIPIDVAYDECNIAY